MNWYYRTPPFLWCTLISKRFFLNLLQRSLSLASQFLLLCQSFLPVWSFLWQLSPKIFPSYLFILCGIYKYLIIRWWPLRFLWWEDSVVHQLIMPTWQHLLWSCWHRTNLCQSKWTEIHLWDFQARMSIWSSEGCGRMWKHSLKLLLQNGCVTHTAASHRLLTKLFCDS